MPDLSEKLDAIFNTQAVEARSSSVRLAVFYAKQANEKQGLSSQSVSYQKIDDDIANWLAGWGAEMHVICIFAATQNFTDLHEVRKKMTQHIIGIPGCSGSGKTEK